MFQNVSDQVIVFVPPDFTADMVLVDSTHRLKAQRKVLQVSAAFPVFPFVLVTDANINKKSVEKMVILKARQVMVLALCTN